MRNLERRTESAGFLALARENQLLGFVKRFRDDEDELQLKRIT